MAGVVGDIKKLFKFKYKSRADSPTDQYHRLFMTRALLVGTFLTGMKWSVFIFRFVFVILYNYEVVI